MRLDRFLSNLPQLNRQAARQLLASGRVQVDRAVVCDGLCEVSQFSRVEVDNEPLQAGKAARYFMLHKPIGVVSATAHEQHRTVLDLLDEPDKVDLHLAGRLDLNTSGLLIITNDGQWSRRLTEPRSRLGKVYRVETEQPITPEYIEVFARGLYFAYEDLTTLPAELVILDSHSALLTLHEGRYHQVKRMFGHFQNKVIGLHRLSMGAIQLDPHLAPGQYRALTTAEIACV
ncbi:MAG: 16S rRNA pseudouridine(516) synthase [Pseudomonas sp.]|uniref:pseudouridine synthase n=1 Tax=Pseudomonas sp. FEMGT703P TaxID=2080764 RepID=UPI000CA9138D|nr:16S rRNA pseudouridine(516) synthase [Pseudomonas sp. FEMGT703P]PJE41869.1 MAG: 16S rRNA pseudouridine(516) synthase [Pseudomonas sp.] [Pseudomonas sp. FEMGT703P]